MVGVVLVVDVVVGLVWVKYNQRTDVVVTGVHRERTGFLFRNICTDSEHDFRYKLRKNKAKFLSEIQSCHTSSHMRTENTEKQINSEIAKKFIAGK